MKALFIYNRNIWMKRWTSYFIFGMVFLLVFLPAFPSLVSGGEAAVMPSTYAFTGAVAISLTISNIMLFGSNFMELRKTSLLKRLGITRLSKLELVVGYALWFLVVDLLIIVFAFLVMGIFILANVYEPMNFASFTFSGVIWGLTMMIVLSLAIGYFFAIISKSFAVFNMLSTFYLILYVITVAVGGLLNSFNVEIGILHIFYYFLPTSFVIEFLRGSFSGANVWSIATGYYIIPQVEFTYIGVGQTNLDIWMPIVYTGALIYGTNYLFRWDQK